MNITSIWRRHGPLTLIPFALGLGGASTTIASSEASASTGIEICIEWNDVLHCVWIPHAINWRDVVCPGCPPEFEIRDDVVTNPALSRTIAGEVSDGLGDLLLAEVLGDRNAAATGLDHLVRAAALAGPNVTGSEPSPQPWAQAVQQHLASGLDLLKQAAGLRDRAAAQRLHDQAVGAFGEAVDVLADQITVG